MDWYWIAIIALCALIAPPVIGVTWHEAPGLRRLVKRIMDGRQ